MCDLCDGKVTVAEYFGIAERRRMLRVATEREVFQSVRDRWWGMDCHVCRFRVEGLRTRLDAEFALLMHCYDVHREDRHQV